MRSRFRAACSECGETLSIRYPSRDHAKVSGQAEASRNDHECKRESEAFAVVVEEVDSNE
jgi:hypothetical protein